ncbi:hypothetical protein AUJ17_01695 [Candidatus Micrarchaeota archaeon CG1_02_47_40]|nr:MAG: hypothetical protein AUJ17_01695 [Candidatus Micrarchaeota archaeon CG1_02_47_40]
MAYELLSKYKIDTAPSILCKDEKSASKYAKKFGYPVVLKIISDKIVHKTEVGAVKAGIEGEGELLHAFRAMRGKFPSESAGGILLQKMIRGIELIVGGKSDEQFGQLLIFGLGGIYVEYLKDVSARVCPVSREEAQKMIKEIKTYSILRGVRTGRPVNEKAIIDVIVKTSSLLLKENPRELDFNPLIANKEGAYVVDARVIR